ncbi:secretion system protein [Saccharopolyspora karakumensis]|uniref:Secretion system protein n=1 Tax=Saccharopolyspora karakumensis TaxID=2530386 RepID=A0A4V2YX05_9PSEU|nr:secretion system protein [Saccharopolyspora karakumensis]
MLAAGWDLLAAGMRAGLPVPVIVRAVAVEVDGTARRTLNEVADHLALGSDAAAGWEPALRDPDTAELARAARRTARTGSALADVAAELADRARARSSELAEVRAQRGAVWISAPLGLCFLPAFLCLGVLPVVLGMFDRIPINPL